VGVGRPREWSERGIGGVIALLDVKVEVSGEGTGPDGTEVLAVIPSSTLSCCCSEVLILGEGPNHGLFCVLMMGAPVVPVEAACGGRSF